ncbi:thioredoxin domain-containing protein [Chitinophaga nivalis]|uniref:Thioredoxin domain-containing protein n=1 Tax=Chitinophaga nivalis TaxID=2991709 RepID=A0ABT3IUH8_9BACT|nr:thioredoxin domain-containing protein [Chitinophaga nivalis]MCW3462689.1 thioredoxin domain-containing protein [Chitinophaga nivalis]MCW3487620.1 thioredoxin domain-containing protein [Chitinophaga nivalis]
MNKLIGETSPYLLQHAHNPVNWYPWGEEALQRALQEDKPILVSIGYAACHWCHVMERESFENEATAAIMNEHFINIKIDREERPDLDHIYMDALQAMTGAGGWPLNVFLTPDKKPFYGGTYFPPTKAYNRPSWTDVLLSLADAFHNKREEINTQADNLTQHIHQSSQFGIQAGADLNIPREELFTKAQCDTICENILKQADTVWGGFGRAPKFPQTFTIAYLLRYHHFYQHPEALQQAVLSLDKMLQGGLYDQLGGGFARYSTDEKWLAPHFEKMLYDNALLIDVLCDAYQITGNNVYAQTVKDTLTFITREMTSPEGGFYAALDADSEGVEGKFYVWSREEIDQILGEQAPVFCDFYDVQEHGNWEEQNILWVRQPLQQFAVAKGYDPAELATTLQQCRGKLLAVREGRIRPGLDDKILLGWNALMVHACCKAFAALGDETYRELAVRNMDFCLAVFREDAHGQEFYHTWKNGIAKYPAFLDDYAYLIRALIALQEITGDMTYLYKAHDITAFVNDYFGDDSGQYFYYTIDGQDDVIVRKKEIYDGAVPSGNAIMIQNLWYLALVFDNKDWADKAVRATSALSQTVVRYPTSFGVWASQLLQFVTGTAELAIVGADYRARMNDAGQWFIPYRVLVGAPADVSGIPLLSQRATGESTLVYLCKDYHCIKPVSYIEEIINLI